MKIVYLNPWKQAAENQAFRSLEESALRIGCTLIHCVNSDEIIASAPDFVLATASTQPKLTSFPTYGVIHEPRDRFLGNREYYHNLLTYDGYLTISESLEQFLKSLLNGVSRRDGIGYYYNSCQSNSSQETTVAKVLREGRARLTYFGTNWDKRRHSFFKKFSNLPGVEIYGPQHSWEHINPAAYKGALPFDGEGPQKKYAENGLGLVLLSEKHLLDDVISNRIFEITSVGAVAVCPRIPWIEKHYGDSVYYFNQLVSDNELLMQLSDVLQEVHRNPDQAADRARRAYQIFCDNFSAEKLLKNACDYHLQKLKATLDSRKPNAQGGSPPISVIVRCGGRSTNSIERALDSIVRQTAGKFRILLVRYMAIDLKVILRKYESSFEDISVLDCLGGNRSETLWHGLSKVTGDYFCILDDDDEWMPKHIENLLPTEGKASKPYFAYSGSIRVYKEPKITIENNPERRHIYSFGDCRTVPFLETATFFSSNCFLASTDLLKDILMEVPTLQTAEDSLLILQLIAQCEPRFNYRATAIHHESVDASNFNDHPNRTKDLLNLLCRLAGKIPAWPIVLDMHSALNAQSQSFLEEEAKRHHWTLKGREVPAPKSSGHRSESVSEWRRRTFSRWSKSLRKRLPKGFGKQERPRYD